MTDGKSVTAADLDLPGNAEEQPCAINLRAAREVADRRAIRQAMSRTDNNISGAAKLLGSQPSDALRPAQAISSASVADSFDERICGVAAAR